MKRNYYKIITFITLLLFFGCNNEPTNQEKIEIKTTVDSIVQVDTIIPVIQPKYKIKIKDERKLDSEIEQFMNRFEKVIQNKDVKELLKICDDSIVLSYGGGVFGKKNFINNFKLNNKNSGFWLMGEKYLHLGGEITNEVGIKSYRFPTVFSLQNPKIQKERENAIYNVMHIIKDSVVVFEKPDEKSKKVALFMMSSVLWDNQKSIGFEDDQYLPLWCYVYTFDKKYSGFIKREYLYAEPEYSFSIQKKNGQYKIVSFAPFD